MLKNSVIEKLIEEKNLSQTKVAERIGMSREGFGRMLKGKTMKVSTLDKIAKVLNVPITYFFKEEPYAENETVSSTIEDSKTLYNTNLKQKNMLETIKLQRETIDALKDANTIQAKRIIELEDLCDNNGNAISKDAG